MGTVIDFNTVPSSLSQANMLAPDDPDLKLFQLVDESRRLKVRLIELHRLIEQEMERRSP